MPNYAKLHGEGKIMVDYQIDVPCPQEKKCEMCYLKKIIPKNRIKKKSTKEIVSDLNSLNEQGYKTYLVTSDILNREDYLEIIKASRQKHILTTGIPILKNISILKELKSEGIEQIVLSSNLENIVDDLSLPSLEVTIETTKLARENGFRVMYTYIINKKNYLLSRDMIKQAKTNGATDLRFMQYIPFEGNDKLMLTREELNEFLTNNYEIQDSNDFLEKDISLSRGSTLSSPEHRKIKFSNKSSLCTAGTRSLMIGLDNFVYPCIFLTVPSQRIGIYKNQEITLDDNYEEKIFCKNSIYCKAADRFRGKK